MSKVSGLVAFGGATLSKYPNTVGVHGSFVDLDITPMKWIDAHNLNWNTLGVRWVRLNTTWVDGSLRFE